MGPWSRQCSSKNKPESARLFQWPLGRRASCLFLRGPGGVGPSDARGLANQRGSSPGGLGAWGTRRPTCSPGDAPAVAPVDLGQASLGGQCCSTAASCALEGRALAGTKKSGASSAWLGTPSKGFPGPSLSRLCRSPPAGCQAPPNAHLERGRGR